MGQKSVTREDSYSFAIDAVVCGAAPTEIIVVHTGEIVVNEGVGVNAFDGASGGNRKGLFSPNGSSGG